MKSVLEEFPKCEQAVMYLSNIGITSDYEVLEALEAYKFLSRNEILQSADCVTADKSEVIHDYPVLEDKYSIVIEKSGENEVRVYAPLYQDVNITALVLDLGLVDIQVICITPLNYDELRKDNFVYKYNADILFKRILIEALRLKATDLHFDVKHVNGQPKYSISCRRGSKLLEIPSFEISKELNAEIISKLIETNTKVSSLDLLDPSGVIGNAVNILGDNAVELRIAANRALDGYHYVIRIQKKETLGFTLDQLGFHENVLRDLRTVMEKRSGITFVTGAVRTGKNTTVFAALNELVGEPIKILSYESPIEVIMPFTQVDYLGDTDILLNAVRLAKKQDVNIAYLNELPDKSVAFAVRDLANSSVHVITTMHMDRIWHLPYKLKEYFGDDYKDIISQINGVFDQKMFDVCCQECSEQMMVSDVDSKYKNKLSSIGLETVRVSKGCTACNSSGIAQGKNQPYVEHLIFDEDLVDRLLKCDHPYQMEVILRDEVRKRSQALEDYMRIGFENGSIPLSAVNQL